MKIIATTHSKYWPRPHCATICPHQEGTLIAYYRGPECSNDQAVVIEYWTNKLVKKYQLVLPTRTGNCVLIPVAENLATLVFSYFEDSDGIRKPEHPVQRWMFCSNWKTNIEAIQDGFRLDNYSRFPMPYEIGYLVRCAPLKVGDEFYLPVYHEHDCYGEIIRFAGKEWKTLGTIGKGENKLIQPTIWYDGVRIRSLSRNTTGSGFAWYSESRDGKTWSDPIQANLTNWNNSVIVIQDGTTEPLIVWNDGPNRQVLNLGRWNQQKLTATPILKLNESNYGSYPNYCYDQQGRLQIVFTERTGITRHILE